MRHAGERISRPVRDGRPRGSLSTRGRRAVAWLSTASARRRRDRSRGSGTSAAQCSKMPTSSGETGRRDELTERPRIVTVGENAATAPRGAVAQRRQAADPGIARKPGGGNLVGEVTIHRRQNRATGHPAWQKCCKAKRFTSASGALLTTDTRPPERTPRTVVSSPRTLVGRAKSFAD
jgi:hypothetical protein